MYNKPNPLLNRTTQPKISQKKISGIQPLDYNNSFTRLFIGETDEDSIRERYLSNMVVKKHKQLHLLNNYMDLSSMYLKRMYYKLFKKEGEKGAMDKDMINVINQFENDHKKVENYQRVSSDKHPYDYAKSQLLIELQNQRQKYAKKPKKKKRKNTFMSTSVSRNVEVTKVNNEPSNININMKTNMTGKSRTRLHLFKNNSKTNNTLLSSYKKETNPCENNRYKYIKKSNSVLSEKNSYYGKKVHRSASSEYGIYNNQNYCFRYKNTIIFLKNRKKYNLQNYMNKKDFFFSEF